jgi:hypothetical protein
VKVAASVWLNVPANGRLQVMLHAVPPLLNGPPPSGKSSASIRAKVQPKPSGVQAVQFPSAALTSRLTREVRPAGVLPMAAQWFPVRRLCLPVHLCNVQ